MRSQVTSGSVVDSPRLSWSIGYSYYDNGNMASRSPSDQSDPTDFEYDFLGDDQVDDSHLMMGASEDSAYVFSLSWDENGNMSDKAMTVPAEDDTVLTYNWDKKLRQGDKGSATIKLKYDGGGNRTTRK